MNGMQQVDVYTTISEPSEGIYKEKGSKFLAFAFPVMEEEQIKNHIQELKQKYYDARHHCYAWQLGLDDNHFRVNDDGEPSGTAGKPIHGQIRSHGITNLLIVVVRYFGGTKLGTSGLINAYKCASANALANANQVEKTINNHYKVQYSYAVMNDVMRVIKEEEPDITYQQFDINCLMQLSVRQSKSDVLVTKLEKIESVFIDFVFTR